MYISLYFSIILILTGFYLILFYLSYFITGGTIENYIHYNYHYEYDDYAKLNDSRRR